MLQRDLLLYRFLNALLAALKGSLLGLELFLRDFSANQLLKYSPPPRCPSGKSTLTALHERTGSGKTVDEIVSWRGREDPHKEAAVAGAQPAPSRLCSPRGSTGAPGDHSPRQGIYPTNGIRTIQNFRCEVEIQGPEEASGTLRGN